MVNAFQLIATFLHPVTLLVALAFGISVIHRKGVGAVNRTLVMSVGFGLAVAYTMASPIEVQEGIVFDMRNLMIGSAVALGGPIPGLVALATGLAFRIEIGGTGMLTGIVSMALAFVIGWLWRVFVRHRAIPSWSKSLILGLGLTGTLVAILLLPRELWGQLLAKFVPYLGTCYLIGVFLLRFIVDRELRFLSDVESWHRRVSLDHLTGLKNRYGLETAFEALPGDGKALHGTAVLCLDIDDFKTVNDRLGHAAGDELLQRITERLRRTLRKTDIFARIGGDEFVIVLPSITREDADDVARRCQAQVAAAPFALAASEVTASVSMGATWSESCMDLSKALNAADRALYDAKNRGKDGLVFAPPSYAKRDGPTQGQALTDLAVTG